MYTVFSSISVKKYSLLSLVVMLFCSYALCACGGEDPVSPEPAPDPTPSLPSYTPLRSLAFPGADGGGRNTQGGAEGTVYVVTSLEDSTLPPVGTLRHAINQSGARTIVFAVSGTIHLKAKLDINKDNITIAGQTAPGDGICLADYPVTINANEVIIRFVRFRMGDIKQVEDDALGASHHDGKTKKNIIIDHCSISWSTDECASFYGNENFTLQWCLISESLNNSLHEKGTHGYGGIWGGKNASFHHNLLAHHNSRNPRFDHDYVSTMPGPIDYVNNVVYNWGGNSTYGGESAPGNQRNINIVNNYYKPGPATGSGVKTRIMQCWNSCENCNKSETNNPAVPAALYVNGNYMDGKGANWDWSGIVMAGKGIYSVADIKNSKVFSSGLSALNFQETAEEAYASVLKYTGASLVRDAVDTRIVKETTQGTATYNGSNGSKNGLIDSQQDVGGWPELTGKEAPLDTDGDGMPDAWEKSNGLNPEKKDHANYNLSKAYTNLEIYLNELAQSCFPSGAKANEIK